MKKIAIDIVTKQYSIILNIWSLCFKSVKIFYRFQKWFKI